MSPYNLLFLGFVMTPFGDSGPQNQHSVRYTHFVDVFRLTNFNQNLHSVQHTHFVDEPIFQSTNPINILYNKPILLMYSDKKFSIRINILRKIPILLIIKTIKKSPKDFSTKNPVQNSHFLLLRIIILCNNSFSFMNQGYRIVQRANVTCQIPQFPIPTQTERQL